MIDAPLAHLGIRRRYAVSPDVVFRAFTEATA
jgi:hypothetical protein